MAKDSKPITIERNHIGEYMISTVAVLRRPTGGVTYFYETVVFCPGKDIDFYKKFDKTKIPFPTNEKRYHTEEQARQSHKEVVSDIEKIILN